VEKALSLTPGQAAKASSSSLKRFDAVYIGSETCQNLLASRADVDALAAKFKGTIVLSTALLDEAALESALSLAGHAARKFGYDRIEVAVNDYGFLSELKREHKGRMKVSAGRLMMLNILGVWRQIDTPYLTYLSENFGVAALEADNPFYLYKRGPESPFAVHFHTPLRLLATTRYCAYSDKFPACGRLCRDRQLKLKNTQLKGGFIVSFNNGYYMREKPFSHPLVTRTVHTPADGKSS